MYGPTFSLLSVPYNVQGLDDGVELNEKVALNILKAKCSSVCEFPCMRYIPGVRRAWCMLVSCLHMSLGV